MTSLNLHRFYSSFFSLYLYHFSFFFSIFSHFYKHFQERGICHCIKIGIWLWPCVKNYFIIIITYSYKLELDLYVDTQVWYTNIVLSIGVRNKNKIFILYIYVCYNTCCTFDIRYIVYVHYIFCRKIQLGMLMPFYGKIDQEYQFHRRWDQDKYSMSLISHIYVLVFRNIWNATFPLVLIWHLSAGYISMSIWLE